MASEFFDSVWKSIVAPRSSWIYLPSIVIAILFLGTLFELLPKKWNVALRWILSVVAALVVFAAVQYGFNQLIKQKAPSV